MKSLYTNIPHEEGIDAVLTYVTRYRNAMPSYAPPNHVFRNMLHLILGNSIFEFLEEIYQQISGTSMRTRMAPPYANLFMGVLEDVFRGTIPELNQFWKRFIADIFFIFVGSEQRLKDICKQMNSSHPTIKFTFEYSHERIVFLDIMVYVDSHLRLQATIFRKPTHRICLLHFSSHHPLHVKRSIIYTQALRYCTIISEDQNLQIELHVLTRTLLSRDYPLDLIIEGLRKALSHIRDSLLTPKEPGISEDVTPLVVQYNPMGMKVKEIVHNHWKNIADNPHLKRIWTGLPVTAYTRGKNIRDRLVHSRQTKTPL